MKFLHFFALLMFTTPLLAEEVVNVYVWGGEIPKQIVQQFEQESGIKVNFSTYDSNETLYAKLKASNSSIYDVILPSAYFVERMRKQDMLMQLDAKQLPNKINIMPSFRQSDYDPGNRYSLPLLWGATGIFYNQAYITNPPTSWKQLWEQRWRNKMMLLDDSREVFAIALLSLGFNPNDSDPKHIRLAYDRLLQLVPNIKLFASDSIQAILIDEDALIGSAWNGDVFKAQHENKAVQFVFPQEGFVVWVDCLAIPKNPPHLQQAYRFINFLLRPDVAAQIALLEGHAIANQAGWERLPEAVRNNTSVYPDAKTLQRSYFQRDVGEDALALYNQYWEQLKLAF